MAARLALVVLASGLIAAAIPAQLPGPGLTWTGSSGGNAGGFIPSCSNAPVTAVRGESVSVRVWGDPKAPFALLAAAGGHQCLPIPGLGNALVLDPPLVPIAFGTLTQSSPCLSCPPGFQELQFSVPRTLPLGAAASFQALGFGAGNPAFTAAVTATIG